MDTPNHHDTTTDDGEPRSNTPGGAAAAWSGPAADLLALGETLDAHSGRLPDGVTGDALVQALAGLRSAQERVERAALAVLGAARALDVTWPRIGAALGLTAGGARDLYTRLGRRHTDYTPPLAPTLSAHTKRAAELLEPVMAEFRASPNQVHLATRSLGAVLLAQALAGADDARVRSWLDDDTLGVPRQVLRDHHGDQAGAALGVLHAHALDPRPMRQGLVELMRRALVVPLPDELDPAPAPPLPAAGPGAEAETAAVAVAVAEHSD